MESSLERLPCVPAVMEKREPLPSVWKSAVLLFDKSLPAAAGAEGHADLYVGPSRSSAGRDVAGLLHRFQ